MTYEIEYRETSVGFFDVEAEDESSAIEKFWDMVSNGEINLCVDTQIMDSDTNVVSCCFPQEILSAVLEDDDSPYGGIAFEGETVADFLDSMFSDSDILSMEDLNMALIDNGIKPIRPAEVLHNED